MLKVVKSSAAKVEPLPLVGEGSDNYAGDEMVTKVVPVRNVSVRELAPILRQMIDSAGSGNVVNYDPLQRDYAYRTRLRCGAPDGSDPARGSRG